MEVGKFSRVNGAWLKENVGNQVALVGKVVESDADTVKITASVRSFLFVFEILTCFNQHEDLICLFMFLHALKSLNLYIEKFPRFSSRSDRSTPTQPTQL